MWPLLTLRVADAVVMLGGIQSPRGHGNPMGMGMCQAPGPWEKEPGLGSSRVGKESSIGACPPLHPAMGKRSK